MRRPAPHLPVLGALVLAAAAAGCATGGGPPPSAPDAGEAGEDPRWVRQVTGITVRDSAGDSYRHPFLGGFNGPRPQLMDVDGDGDPDLFLQERTGEVMLFENVDTVGSGDAPDFTWRTDDYRDLDVGEWYRFGDLDLDGDRDLLTQEPFSHVRYYRNDGAPGKPDFTLAADTLRTEAGEPLYSDPQNIPNVGNIDCDDRQDLLVGRLDGTVTRFEASGFGRDTGGTAGSGGGDGLVPRFRRVTERFQDIEIVAEIAGVRHGANSLLVTDFDGDGDPDLFWGDYFESGLLYIENTGSCSQPNLRSQPVPFPPEDPIETSGYNAPTFGDVDGDGDRDLLIGVIGGAYNPLLTSADNLYYLENTDSGWSLRTRRFLSGLDVGEESVPAFADLDRDGDDDLLLANKLDPEERTTSVIRRFENVGTDGDPEWRRAGSLPMRGDYQYAPAFGDLDGDGDEDLVLADWRDELTFYRNEGPSRAEGDSVETGSRGDGSWDSFSVADSTLVTLTRGSHAVPALGDVDDDGDLDLFVGESSGFLNFYRNVGSASEPEFEPVSDEYGGFNVGRRSAPTLTDLDGDGDLDLLVGSQERGIRIFRNEGTPEEPDFVADGRLDAATRGLSVPVLRDSDGDGALELFSGSAGGGVLYYQQDSGR